MQKGGMFLLESIKPDNIFTPEDFTDEHKMIADTVSDFSENEIQTRADELDEQKEGLSRSLLEQAGELGLLSADIPEEYEGSELGKIASAIIAENLVGGGFSVTFNAHTGIGTLPIVMFGNEDQKKKYLPGLGTGRLVGAYALTEPNAGSDALGSKTKAVLSEDGKHYILNGEKIFISNAGFADVIITYAKIDGDKFTAFIVDRDTPGLTVGPEEKKMGIKASSTCPLIFEDAKIPVENVLGEIGKGHVIAFNILNIGRYKLGASAVGSSKMSLRISSKYAKERNQFNTPIGKFGMVQNKLAKMATKIYGCESLVYRMVGDIEEALEGKTDGSEIAKAVEDYAVECSIAKVHGSEVLDYCTDEAVQIHGGYGYIKEYEVERGYRDSRINRIFEGTNEVNRLIIPGTVLRRAMKGELPFMQAAQQLQDELTEIRAQVPTGGEEPLEIETDMVERAKKLLLMVGGTAAQKYQKELNNEQEILQILADMAIEIYAMESAVLRAKKAMNNNDDNKDLKIQLATLYVHEVFPNFDGWAKEALAYIYEPGDMLRTNLSIARRLSKYYPVDLVSLRRSIASQVLEENNYVV